MNRRITIIITTDFCCWIPFIVICALHFLEILNATRWYSIFSMLVLPINSVINPLLYDEFIFRIGRTPLRSILTSLKNTVIYQSFIARLSTTNAETIEMEEIGVQDDGTRSAIARNPVRTE